jgi:hypothetical protein
MDKNYNNKGTKNSATDKTTEESDAVKSLHQRRIQDGKTLKNSTRTMNLDRRCQNSDRRGNGAPNYKGPSRRFTIDRRLVTKDRRKNG